MTMLDDIIEGAATTHDVATEATKGRQTQESPTPGSKQQQQQQKQPTLPSQDDLPPLTKEEIYRPAAAALLTSLGAAFLVGGMFTGIVMPRLYASIGAIIGVGMAVVAARATKRETLWQAVSLAGVFFGGLILLVIGGGVGALSTLGDTVGSAVGDAQFRRPPVFFDTGWKALVPWTTGLIGYTAAYVGTVGRKPAVGLLIPIPVIAFTAIAQPPEAQVPAGIVAFVTFAIGLATIYRADRGEGVSTAYELKRAARALRLIIPLIAALIALSQTGFLFPDPLYDPTQLAQKPKPIPLDAVEDRVLFETTGDFTGPWRAGILSVLDPEGAWRLPPFNQEEFVNAPESGLLGEIFDNDVPAEVRAEVTVRGLDGVVLPMPARAHGIAAEGAPQLVVDPEAQTVRVDVGQVENGLTYTVVFALLPTEDQLRSAGPVLDEEFLAKWTEVPNNMPPPPTVSELLAEAPRDNLFDRFNFLREFLLETVTAAGQGLPTEVPAERVEDMLAGSKEGSPYEIVAAQALLARWAGVPARIGYGFDRGEEQGSIREFRPLHGSAWVEVFFEGHGWLPITGLPKKAKETINSDEQQLDVQVLPGDDISVEVYIPTRVTPPGLIFQVVQKVLALVLPVVFVLGSIWVLWPMAYKARRTSRRRQWALEQGRHARIAVAYAEFRDLATDLGVGDPYATPLQYVEQVVPDEEHDELAWLVTRTLWGDLKNSVGDDEVYAAEELSRALRRRIFEAQPFTIRGLAYVSRLSLRDPYAPELVSPPVPKVEPVAIARKALLRIVGLVPFRRKKGREVLDEALQDR